MKVQHGKDVANHSGLELCGDARESAAEALIGETGGSAGGTLLCVSYLRQEPYAVTLYVRICAGGGQ